MTTAMIAILDPSCVLENVFNRANFSVFIFNSFNQSTTLIDHDVKLFCIKNVITRFQNSNKSLEVKKLICSLLIFDNLLWS